MNAIERSLIWLGVEDYTGLWDASFEARSAPGVHSIEDARQYARQVVESLLARGWIELYICQEPLSNDSVELVAAEDRSRVLENDESWEVPESLGKSVRFATTDEGLAVYRSEAE